METAIRSEPSVRFEGFELNLQTHELFRSGLRIKIRGHPVDVLAILLEHAGELVTREMLRHRLWPDNTFVDSEQILNNSVGKLREVLGDNAENPKFIETLPRLGYRFIAPLNGTGSELHGGHAAIATTHAIVSVLADPNVHRRSRHRRFWGSIAFAAIALGLASYWFLQIRRSAPHISHYEQLTLDADRKTAVGTDGTRIYMVLQRLQPAIAQVPVSGGKVTEIPIGLDSLTELTLLDVSPDGTSLLVGNQNSNQEGHTVWVVGSSGRPARYLTKAYCAVWSPDGRTIAYANSHGDILTSTTEGGEPQLLLRVDAPQQQITVTLDMSWSPDGKKIRFTRWGGRIFEIASNGANLHEWLPGWNAGVRKCCGRWTSDGQFFVFLAGAALGKGPRVRPLAQIWVADERSGRMLPRTFETTLLTPGPLLWGNPIPGRDGKKIYARGVSLRGELQRYDQKSQRLEPFLGGISAEMLDFSRDGKYVAYVSFADGILWRANRDGSGPVQVTEPPLYPRNPRWSPDGTQLLFTDNTQSGVDVLYVVPSQGGTPKRLLPDDIGPQSIGDWSPDGARVVYTTHSGFSFVPRNENKFESRIVDLATGRTTVLPKAPEGFWAPLWSPDGRYIAGNSLNQMKLSIFDLRTGEWSAIPDTASMPIGYHHWSHDGRFLYFTRWTGGGVRAVYRVLVPRGKEELVFEPPENFQGTGWYSFWMSLDPDDSPLLLRDAGTDEIYALTLERK